jgi:hypothetical protein
MSALDELQKKYEAGTLDDVELAIWWFAGFDKSYNHGKVDHSEVAAAKYAELRANTYPGYKREKQIRIKAEAREIGRAHV